MSMQMVIEHPGDRFCYEKPDELESLSDEALQLVAAYGRIGAAIAEGLGIGGEGWSQHPLMQRLARDPEYLSALHDLYAHGTTVGWAERGRASWR